MCVQRGGFPATNVQVFADVLCGGYHRLYRGGGGHWSVVHPLSCPWMVGGFWGFLLRLIIKRLKKADTCLLWLASQQRQPETQEGSFGAGLRADSEAGLCVSEQLVLTRNSARPFHLASPRPRLPSSCQKRPHLKNSKGCGGILKCMCGRRLSNLPFIGPRKLRSPASNWLALSERLAARLASAWKLNPTIKNQCQERTMGLVITVEASCSELPFPWQRA